MKVERARRVAAGDPIALMMQKGHERAEANRRAEERRERDRLRRLLDLDNEAELKTTTWEGAKRSRKRRIDLSRAIKNAIDAGLSIKGATVSADGSVSLEFASHEGIENVREGKTAKTNRWDEVMKRGPAKIAFIKR
jgi:hypothetical protein